VTLYVAIQDIRKNNSERLRKTPTITLDVIELYMICDTVVMKPLYKYLFENAELKADRSRNIKMRLISQIP